LVTSYPPNRARLSEYSKLLVCELEKNPQIKSITILADTYEGKKNTQNQNGKVKIKRLWKPDNVFTILGLIPTIFRLKPWIIHFNLHFQSFGRTRLANFTGLSLVALLTFLGRNVIVTMHNYPDRVDLEKVNVKNNTLNKIGLTLATNLLLKADRIVVTVKSYIHDLQTRYRFKKARYIKHGASLTMKKNAENGEKVDVKQILMFGHMAPHKGLPVILEAFQKISEQRNDVVLVVAGSDHPNFPGYLKGFNLDNRHKVKYIGYVSEDNVSRVFDDSYLVVIPYLTTTGTSGVFHLACGASKPIIASNLPEIRELLKEGASAKLVKPGKSQELEKAVELLLDNPIQAKNMGKKNLKYAEKESWETIARQYVQEYIELHRE
jgi:glycosyltransferase involved in cell wall biosynthesis